MIESLIVYTLTAIFLYAIAREAVIRENNTLLKTGHGISIWCPEIIICILIFGFIAGARYDVGVDYKTYLKVFTEYQLKDAITGRKTFEPGFLLITKLFAKTGLHYFFYFAFWGVLQIGLIYYALRYQKKLLPFIGLFIMLGPFFLIWMNGIRQVVACCAFVLMVEYINDRRFWTYLIIALLASTIHRSALLLLPFYFFTYAHVKMDNRVLNLCILLGCVLLGLTQIWLNIVNRSVGILNVIGYTGYAERIDYWTSESLRRDMAWGPSRILTFVIDVVLIWVYPKMRIYFSEDSKLPYYFLFFFIGTCMFNIFANTTHLFLRPSMYFTIFRLPLWAYMAIYFKENNKQLQLLLLLIMCCSSIYLSLFKAYLRPNDPSSEITLYKFFWDSTVQNHL